MVYFICRIQIFLYYLSILRYIYRRVHYYRLSSNGRPYISVCCEKLTAVIINMIIKLEEERIIIDGNFRIRYDIPGMRCI